MTGIRPRRLLRRLALPLLPALALAACAPGGGDDAADAGDAAAEVVVLGAASTRVLNDDLAAAAADLDPALRPTFVNAGSTALVSQLREGSPGDVFISADEKHMADAVAEGLVGEPVDVATNSMVMVVPRGNPAGITGVDDSLDGAKVVLCDVQVPCGRVSAAIQEDLGRDIDAASLEQSVSDVLGKVAGGNADAGWVYRTDAAAAGDDVEVIEIPGAERHINTLVAAVTANPADRAAAQALLELLSSGEFAEVWARHGFDPVAGDDGADA